MVHGTRLTLTVTAALAIWGSAMLFGMNSTAMAQDSSPPAHKVAMSSQSPGWAERLKGQTITENAVEGRAERAAMVERQHQRLMEQMQKEMRHQRPNTGNYNNMSMMHQYGAGKANGLLMSDPDIEPVSNKGGRCPAQAPVKHYDISAINVEITLNAWLDYYPGYMYVLTENLDKVRAEEAKNRAAREVEGHYDPGAIIPGVQNQWIQPLVIRGNQGDCVKFTLRNKLEFGEEVSLHINGSDMVMSNTGQPAVTTNPDSVAAEGQTIEMEWYIHPDMQEGGRQFHTKGSNDRELTVLGLAGAFIVEPRNSKYWEPLGTGPATEARSGWQVMIENGTGPDFREFVVIYHEIGDEAFRPVNKHGDFLPQRDPLTDAYRPGARALNYRSEPFGINNMHIQHEYFGFEDESMAYSSYTFGDASPTIPRSYLGDPAKWRVIHGGSEVFHSHHPHGGSIRWQRSPRATQMPVWNTGQNGPVKYPVIRTKSDRVDVELIGPAEALDLETECGSGLCQWLAGDFLYHCHVAHHYVAGMWGYWRVYNTLQVPGFQNDIMPPLRELPDRLNRIQKPVTSDQLVGKTVNWFGDKFKIVGSGKSNWKSNPPVITIKDWVEMQLVSQGKPGNTDDERGQLMSYDATVMDWVWQGNRAMSEKEATIGKNPKYQPEWQGYKPGQRRPIWFEPRTGKVAWPWVTPHFGKRVPFSKDHNGAPWLEPIRRNDDGTPSVYMAEPGENGRWSLCPERARRTKYNVHFIKTEITLADAQGSEPAIVDKDGLIYVVHEEEAAVRANNDLKYPLILRANIYDCVDWLLTSEWLDDDLTNFQSSKINTHFHFIQFDNQASDGVISGMSYEQSMRPFIQFSKDKDKGLPVPMNAKITRAARAGDRHLHVSNAKQYHVGIPIMVGVDQVGKWEILRIKKIDKGKLTFTHPLKHNHAVGEIVTVEYVWQRFWADADVGTTFWHDHAFGGTTWPHGAVGTIIIEPNGSTWHDPKTGKPIRTGPIADIHTTQRVGHDVAGSFREYMLHIQDTVPHTVNVVTAGNPPGQPVEVALEAGKTVAFIMPPTELIKMTPMPFINGGTHTTGGTFNWRAEPFAQRLANNPDTSKLFSSAVHGDPFTPMLRAYVGDTMVLRMLDVTMNESNVMTLSGHTFWSERYAPDANRKNSLHIGIAERYDLVIADAGGPRRQPGDYLIFNGRFSKFSEGSWGIIRVLDKPVPDLQPLPNQATGGEGIPEPLPVCPSNAPVKKFNVVAIDYPQMNFNPNAPETIEVDFERKIQLRNPDAKIYVLEEDLARVAGGAQPMPLTLRVNVGDCMKVKLTNKMKNSRASFSAMGMAFDPKDSLGLNLGNNPGDQTVAPGGSRTYTYYADPFNGEMQMVVWDFGDVTMNVRNGLYGGIIIGPKGSQYRDPKTGADISLKNSWVADVIVDRTIPGQENRANYRDVALYFQDEDNIMGTAFMPYVQNVAGLTGVNYRSEPYLYREEAGCSLGRMFQPCSVDSPQDPVTPIIEAHAGDPVRVHVFGAGNEQNQMFTIEDHEWPIEPFMEGADMISTVEFAASEGVDVFLSSAGGRNARSADYVWSNGRLNYSQSGQWGLLRVLPAGDQRILPLSGAAPGRRMAEDQPERIKPTPASFKR